MNPRPKPNIKVHPVVKALMQLLQVEGLRSVFSCTSQGLGDTHSTALLIILLWYHSDHGALKGHTSLCLIKRWLESFFIPFFLSNKKSSSKSSNSLYLTFGEKRESLSSPFLCLYLFLYLSTSCSEE